MYFIMYFIVSYNEPDTNKTKKRFVIKRFTKVNLNIKLDLDKNIWVWCCGTQKFQKHPSISIKFVKKKIVGDNSVLSRARNFF